MNFPEFSCAWERRVCATIQTKEFFFMEFSEQVKLYQQTAQGLFNNPDQRISGTIVYLAKEGLYNNPDPKNLAS